MRQCLNNINTTVLFDKKGTSAPAVLPIFAGSSLLSMRLHTSLTKSIKAAASEEEPARSTLSPLLRTVNN